MSYFMSSPPNAVPTIVIGNSAQFSKKRLSLEEFGKEAWFAGVNLAIEMSAIYLESEGKNHADEAFVAATTQTKNILNFGYTELLAGLTLYHVKNVLGLEDQEVQEVVNGMDNMRGIIYPNQEHAIEFQRNLAQSFYNAYAAEMEEPDAVKLYSSEILMKCMVHFVPHLDLVFKASLPFKLVEAVQSIRSWYLEKLSKDMQISLQR